MSAAVEDAIKRLAARFAAEGLPIARYEQEMSNAIRAGYGFGLADAIGVVVGRLTELDGLIGKGSDREIRGQAKELSDLCERIETLAALTPVEPVDREELRRRYPVKT